MRTYSSSELAFHMNQYGEMTVNKSRTHLARVRRPHVQTRARKHGVVVEIDWGRAYSRHIYSHAYARRIDVRAGRLNVRRSGALGLGRTRGISEPRKRRNASKRDTRDASSGLRYIPSRAPPSLHLHYSVPTFAHPTPSIDICNSPW